MRVHVRNEVLRSNLELLKNLLNYIEKLPAKSIDDVEAFVEVSSGSLMPSLEVKTTNSQWRTIRIRWIASKTRESGFFEVYDQGNEGAILFHSGDLSNEANTVLSETIHTINHIVSQRISESGFEQAILSLKQIEIISPDSELFLTMYYPHMNREMAEKWLEGRPCGTYLFRKDPFANILEEELIMRFIEPIRCFTLTAILDEGKVIDYTVVERLGRYQVYNDDPQLTKPCFSSLIDLLGSLFEVCKIPLRNRDSHD